MSTQLSLRGICLILETFLLDQFNVQKVISSTKGKETTYFQIRLDLFMYSRELNGLFRGSAHSLEIMIVAHESRHSESRCQITI
jgi:hypothetical protein